MHGRKPKHFDLEERLGRYASAIEPDPARWAGRWAVACYPGIGAVGTGPGRFREVRLDLGCGKGSFLAAEAAREPDVLFVGVDFEPACVAYAAQAVCEAGLANCVVVPGKGEDVCRVFAPGELSLIHVNFPTPFPKKRDAHLRLVALERLLEYRQALAPGGVLWLRTDSQPLRDFARGQLALAGYETLWDLDDERGAEAASDSSLPPWATSLPATYYEERLTARGAKVLSLAATPVPGFDTAHVRQTRSLSLVDYLPADLDDLDYLPYGMEWTVETIRRCRRGHVAAGGRIGTRDPNA